jgi:hypothetical protein
LSTILNRPEDLRQTFLDAGYYLNRPKRVIPINSRNYN